MDTLPFDIAPTPMKSVEDMTQRELSMETYRLLNEVHYFISVIKGNYDKIVESIDIDSITLGELTGMSPRALSRWRSNKKLRYHVRRDGTRYYKFEELYVDVKSGRLDGKGFCRLETLARLKAYFRGNIKSHIAEITLTDKDFDD